MVLRSGIAVNGTLVGDASDDSDALPHVWTCYRDDRHFVQGSLSAGTSLNRLPEKHAAVGGSLKLSTGTLFWNGGVRVPLPAPTELAEPQQSFWSRLRRGAQSIGGGGGGGPALRGTSLAPSGTRFGVRTTALAAMHEAQVAGNGHTAWTLMQPARIKGHAFIVQELPLPLTSTRSGAAWLKVKVQTPSSSRFVNADRTTREGPTERGRITAALCADQLIADDYSKLSLGVRSHYRTSQGAATLQCRSEPVEVFCKLQHNKQVLQATWQPRSGVRVYLNKAF